MTTKLEKEFTGIGEVAGFKFVQLKESHNCYMYQVNTGVSVHYEIFYKKQSAICIDFENRVYSETEFKEAYPKSEAFGVWAWTKSNLRDANIIFNSITNEARIFPEIDIKNLTRILIEKKNENKVVINNPLI